jgi:membrane protein DedA with SNARE-associated domain
MSRNWIYFSSQILAIPLVGLPAIAAAFVVGSWVCSQMGLDSDLLFGIAGCMAGASVSWICARFIGRVLVRLGMLPFGAERKYPAGRSWRDYETDPRHEK